MKVLDSLINEVRRYTANEDYGDTEGIPQQTLIDLFNDAQERLQSRILAENPDSPVFEKTDTISVTSASRGYALPADIYNNNKLRHVEYKDSGAADTEYRDLSFKTLNELPVETGYPSVYALQGSNILFGPHPERAGTVRITYPGRLDRLDIRRGTISSVSTSGGDLVYIELTADVPTFSGEDWCCVVNRYGTVQQYDIGIDSYDSSTKRITAVASTSTSLTTGSNAGDYVVLGKRTTTHSTLPTEWERALTAYVRWQILKLDSSNDAAEAEAEYIGIERDIISANETEVQDLGHIPIINTYFT